MNKKIYLVTGGLGFIGSHLVEKLIKKNFSVIVVDDLSSGKEENLASISCNKDLKILIKKIQDVDDRIFKYICGIYHLGAQTSVQKSIENPYYSSSNNIMSSIKVFEIAKKYNIPIVYASSSAVYGNLKSGDDSKDNIELISPYAFDKYSLELIARTFFNTYGIKSIGLRFFNVYGPKQDPDSPYSGVISIFIKRLLSSKLITVYGGSQKRDFVYVGDIVDCMIKAMNMVKLSNLCESINIGSGKETSIDNLLNLLSKKIYNKSKVKHLGHMKGDPLSSNGKFKRLFKILKINNTHFLKLSDGLDKTIKSLEKK